jgi:signal transduction histidine kinase
MLAESEVSPQRSKNAQGHGSLSGIGLAICNSIVEAGGGNIAADDNPSGGARFTFTLSVFVPLEPE